MAHGLRPPTLRDMAAVGKRILIGYDGTQPSRRALERSAEIAGYASSVTLVNVAPPLYPKSRSGIPDPRALADGKRLLEEARDELARRHVRADVVEPVGEAAEALVDAARDLHADLVILGTHGRGAVGRLLHGSVSEAVIREAPCDVMVVR
jgi:nucleotide-binding universal stress UspA family protein